jgi:hypothetical protein
MDQAPGRTDTGGGGEPDAPCSAPLAVRTQPTQRRARLRGRLSLTRAQHPAARLSGWPNKTSTGPNLSRSALERWGRCSAGPGAASTPSVSVPALRGAAAARSSWRLRQRCDPGHGCQHVARAGSRAGLAWHAGWLVHGRMQVTGGPCGSGRRGLHDPPAAAHRWWVHACRALKRLQPRMRTAKWSQTRALRTTRQPTHARALWWVAWDGRPAGGKVQGSGGQPQPACCLPAWQPCVAP